MADRTQPRPDGQPRPQSAVSADTQQRRRRETAEERRSRQTAAALAKQVDLKREAAERRARKSRS